MLSEAPRIRLPYFLEYFPQVLLISVLIRMLILIEGGNKTRVGSINVTTLPRFYVHRAVNVNEIKILERSRQIDLN